MRSKSLGIDEAVGVLQLLSDQVINHLSILDLLFLGLTDALLFACIIDVPIGRLQVFLFVLKLRLRDFFALQIQVESLRAALHVGIGTHLV